MFCIIKFNYNLFCKHDYEHGYINIHKLFNMAVTHAIETKISKIFDELN